MKSKPNFKLLSWMMVFILSSASLTAQIRGNGNVTEKKRDVPPFTRIEVRSGIDLFLHQTGTPSVTIKADENLQEFIITEVKNSTLYVYVKKNTNIWRSTAMDAYVTVGNLSAVSVSGGGDVSGSGMLKSDHLKLAVSGGGDLDLSLNTGTTELAMSGGGDAGLEGNISELNASLSGGGDIDLKADINTLTLSVSGGGDVEIDTESELAAAKIAISGGGDIEMNAPCKDLKLSISGGGDAEVQAGNKVESAQISVTGGGDIELKLEAQSLELFVNGGGDATLRGSAATLKAELKSGGDLDAENFVVSRAAVSLTGGSGARLNVTEDLDLSAGGGGQVYLEGNPHIDANLTGGSKLHRR